MKKLLLSIVVILVIILTGITIVKGFQIGGLEILGITQIKDENDKLEETVKQATKLASTEYQKKIDDLNGAIKKLETEKSKYEDMVNVSTDSEVQAANQSYENKIEFLYVRIENHAKSEGVTLKMDVTRSSSGAQNVYNLNFTATGTYVGIEEFITNIEDDSKLGFKIEDFKMMASSENGNTVQATFTCRDISINGISSNTVTTTPTNPDITNTNENTTETNNNTTNTNNTVGNNTTK